MAGFQDIGIYEGGKHTEGGLLAARRWSSLTHSVLDREGEMEKFSLQSFLQLEVEEEEEEAGTSLFHPFMAKRKILHSGEDRVCMVFPDKRNNVRSRLS